MPGTVCLQGGAELGPGCRAMDREVLAAAQRVDGAVVVAPLASSPGPDASTTGRGAARYYGALGAGDVVVVAPPRDGREVADAASAVAAARLVVLTGGSPARLLAAFSGAAGEPLRAALRTVLERGGVLSGASAGAMVLGARTFLPDRPGPHGPSLVDALGLVPDVLVLPHFPAEAEEGAGGRGMLDRVPESSAAAALAAGTVLGLPECAGVLVDGDGDGDGAVALGAAPVAVVTPDGVDRYAPGDRVPVGVGPGAAR